ncbi:MULTISPECIES: YraN family protein [Weeksella]|mgnify:CR=1 FL=1|uniref:UPF0102 protein Weevi_0895 n=1 Tax=Weeksella virosa (strain ATCC 43766 / DSM 16922 / JCM 21250 / CCUG 30538 / CDC 9751 / IAM 14551 / NBRC 16016 / NCTC 11634 / CL345/78) TaxID=865938 RepID=F0P1H9_WEEVC|nr:MULTISPECIES: YraN family protein [Weeksella]ADX67607.1 UPF0102 protein yraN [Weeksella virosa DSM 16922]MDK7375376.1 YraN family protein [Weeksella virosa]MDK7676109.1 YraN family protein [Weeksella virosa]OFM82965.1 hypothetical protein HMPREF2660_02735 [Weeksella sp. HMSC059D05]SUP53908.1 Uncharacterised protein family UPF0102 [Weeksella virosa]
MAQHFDFGREAEVKACQFLIEKNYKILDRNFYYQKAEIDIIAQHEQEIVICEVKARSNTFFTEPELAVTKAKQKRLILAADAYIQKNNYHLSVRFDILALTKTNNIWSIKHIENAFNALEN